MRYNQSGDNLIFLRNSVDQKSPVRVVITEATSYIARSLAYRIISDNVFGSDQEIIFSFYDSSECSIFLRATAIEITACAPNLLKDVVYSTEPAVAFKDADVIFSIGTARDYNFVEIDLDSDSFFKDSVLETKQDANAIELYAKKNAKVITLGNTAAKIISEFAPSIPKENISAVSMGLLKLATSLIAKKSEKLASDVKNVIIWGSNSKYAFPYCKYAQFSDGTYAMEAIRDDKWCKKTLPKGLLSSRKIKLHGSVFVKEKNYAKLKRCHVSNYKQVHISARDFLPNVQLLEVVFQKCRCRTSEALALADHCKYLIQGTPECEWTCMSVISDGSYDVTPGVFFSFPVYCRDGSWEIVKDLQVDPYCRKIIKRILISMEEKIQAAWKISHQTHLVYSRRKRSSVRKSIIKLPHELV